MKRRNLVSLVALAVLVILILLRAVGLLDFNVWSLSFTPIVITVAALLDSINPCAFSVLFLSIAFLLSLGHKRSKIITVGLAYVGGIFAVYTAIGLIGIWALQRVNPVPGLMSKIGGTAIIIFGILSLLSEFFPNFPIKLKMPDFSHKYIGKFIEKATFPAAIILGLVVGIFEFPCTGGPYTFILGLLSDISNRTTGILYLVYYNFIFVLPLLVILFIVTDQVVLEKLDRIRRMETKKGRLWVATAFVILGLLVFLI
jgi:cytochrome c-type biogenesis protein